MIPETSLSVTKRDDTRKLRRVLPWNSFRRPFNRRRRRTGEGGAGDWETKETPRTRTGQRDVPRCPYSWVLCQEEVVGSVCSTEEGRRVKGETSK